MCEFAELDSAFASLRLDIRIVFPAARITSESRMTMTRRLPDGIEWSEVLWPFCRKDDSVAVESSKASGSFELVANAGTLGVGTIERPANIGVTGAMVVGGWRLGANTRRRVPFTRRVLALNHTLPGRPLHPSHPAAF